MTPLQKKNFARLLKPRHIAFIGGTDAEIAMGEARRMGYRGLYWPVNSKRNSLGGVSCYATVADLPAAPDAVFLAIPAVAAIAVIDQLSQLGAGGVVCYSAGFAEAGEQGRLAEQALIQAAGEMAVIGPNCYGLINYLDKVALWPFAHGGSTPGYGCAIITQSGMLSSDLTMSQRSLPLTHMVSIGNQAVLALEDLLEQLAEDPRVRALGLHIEGLRDINRFALAALKALQRGKPVVVLKTGSSRIGSALTASHTGSLSGEDDLYNALFQRCGIIRVFSPAQFLETLKFICVAGLPKGNRMAGFTCSGGGATMLADYAEKIGLQFPAFSTSTARQLGKLLPAIATVSNPLDYTTPIWGQCDKTKPVFQQALREQLDIAVLVQDYPAVGLDESKAFYLADARAFGAATRVAQIPSVICSTLPENLDGATREELIAQGIAPMQGINECLDAIAAACDWQTSQYRIKAHPPSELAISMLPNSRTTLDEQQAKQWLQDAGIAVPAACIGSLHQLPKFAPELGYPLVLKMLHPELVHKTDYGAVSLNINSIDELRQAAKAMRTAVTKHQPSAVSDRFLLEQQQAPPIAELIVSIRRDQQFGFAMTLGSGGVLVELVNDALTLLLPATQQDILDALQELRIHRLLRGYRGNPAADLSLLCQCLDKLARFAMVQAATFYELEINPLFVYQNRVCAVDALVSINASQTDST